MNLDPTGSPRHEQTVAVALEFIIAQCVVQSVEHKMDHGQSKVTTPK
jgi:hypothetical protein